MEVARGGAERGVMGKSNVGLGASRLNSQASIRVDRGRDDLNVAWLTIRAEPPVTFEHPSQHEFVGQALRVKFPAGAASTWRYLWWERGWEGGEGGRDASAVA